MPVAASTHDNAESVAKMAAEETAVVEAKAVGAVVKAQAEAAVSLKTATAGQASLTAQDIAVILQQLELPSTVADSGITGDVFATLVPSIVLQAAVFPRPEHLL